MIAISYSTHTSCFFVIIRSRYLVFIYRTDAERRKRKEGRKQLNLMRKYCKLMGFCVLSDIVAAAIQIASVLPEIVYLLIFDINLLANLLCMVLTYAEWQAILFPWLAE